MLVPFEVLIQQNLGESSCSCELFELYRQQLYIQRSPNSHSLTVTILLLLAPLSETLHNEELIGQSAAPVAAAHMAHAALLAQRGTVNISTQDMPHSLTWHHPMSRNTGCF